jgi:hypothetical protein
LLWEQLHGPRHLLDAILALAPKAPTIQYPITIAAA